MEKINLQQKQNINGGFGPMMLWVLVTGACMAASTIASIVASSNTSSTNNSQTTNSTSSSSVGHSNGVLRVSPFPTKSAFIMGF